MSNPVANPIVESSTKPVGNAPVQAQGQSKYVSIIPENGQNYRAGQKIIYNLEPELGFIKARDSYLVFDVLNNSGRNTQTQASQKNLKLELGQAGISSLIKRVNIYSKHSGQLLESLDNYNQWVHTQFQYEHDDITNIQNLEGCPKYIESKCSFQNVASNVASRSINNNKNVMADIENNRLSAIRNADQAPTYTSTRFITPLRCGIFRHWDDEKLVPVLMLGGLRIEIELAPVGEALTIHYTGGRRVGGSVADAVTANNSQGHIFGNANGCGQLIQVTNVANGVNTFRVNFPTGVDVTERLLATGLVVGNMVRVSRVGDTEDKRIVSMAVQGGNSVTITCDSNFGGASDANSFVHLLISSLTAQSVDYLITNTEFRILKVSTGQKPMANMNYEFTTYDLFKDTIPTSQLNFNQEVTSIASKALALFTIFDDPRYTTNSLLSLGSNAVYAGVSAGEVGVNFNDVVYFINNKMMPLNAYNPNPKGDKVITLNEVVKAWSSIGVQCKSLGSGEYADLDIYTNRFMIARQLARDGSVFNLQNAEPQIRLTFTAPRGVDAHNIARNNINMLSYVFSKQIISISDSGLQITK